MANGTAYTIVIYAYKGWVMSNSKICVSVLTSALNYHHLYLNKSSPYSIDSIATMNYRLLWSTHENSIISGTPLFASSDTKP